MVDRGGPHAQPEFDFFVSHNSRDKSLAEAIAERLLDDFGRRSWIDVWAIPAAVDWRVEVDRALDGCRATLALVGPSGWGPIHREETAVALARMVRDSRHIVVPVLLPGGAMDDLAVFGNMHWIDMRNGLDDHEPYQRILTAIAGDPQPFPFGRPRLSPYAIRRDARRWRPTGSLKTNDDVLYRGRVLHLARIVAREHPGQLDAEAVQFIEASIGKTAQRRLRLLVAVSAAMILLAAASVIAELNRRDARRQLAILHREEARRALVEGRPGVAALHLAEALVPPGLEDVGMLAGLATKILAPLDAVLVAHDGRVLDVELSPDGTQAVTGGQDGRAILWSIADRAPLKIIAVGAPVSRVAFSPDGRRILIASHHGDVRIVTGDAIEILRSQQDLISSAEWSPDGTELATGSYDGRLVVWSGHPLNRRDLGVHGAAIMHIEYSRDGTRLLSAGGDQVSVWSTDGRRLQTVDGPRSGVFVARFSTDGQAVFAVETGLAMVRVDIGSGERQMLESSREDTSVVAVDVSPDGRWVAASTSNGSIRLWDASTLALAWKWDDHHHNISATRFHPTEPALMTAGWDGRVRLRDVPSGRTIAVLEGEIQQASTTRFDKSGERIISGGPVGRVALWS